METLPVEIYTDGSCHTQLKIGGWAALILVNGEKVILSGKADNTTHNQMELVAVIKAVEYVKAQYSNTKAIHIFSDSQYVIRLQEREKKLALAQFTTKKGEPVQNKNLVQTLLQYAALLPLHFIKVKAHQKKPEAENYNMEVDQLCRRIVRAAVKEVT